MFKYCLLDLNIVRYFFWYALLGVLASFTLSSMMEHLCLPVTTVTWLTVLVHCVTAAVYTVVSFVALQYGSVIIVTLAYNTSLCFFFAVQFIYFKEVSAPPGLYVEVSGAVLTMVSAAFVPLYDCVEHRRREILNA